MGPTASTQGSGTSITDPRTVRPSRANRSIRTVTHLAAAFAMCTAGLAACTSATPEGQSTVSDPPVSSRSAASCPNPHGGDCLGALQAGSYTTTEFRPTVNYTVPDGWFNPEDLPGNFVLHRRDDDQSGALGGSYIGVWQDAYPAAQDCQEAPQPDVGTSATEFMNWVTGLPTVRATTPAQVSIGGLTGLSTDLVAEGTQPCTFEEGLAPSTPILIGSGVSKVHHVMAEGLSMRLIVLDWQDKNVTIEITSIDQDLPATDYWRIVEPIIYTLIFQDR
jgi:hypothetical protein